MFKKLHFSYGTASLIIIMIIVIIVFFICLIIIMVKDCKPESTLPDLPLAFVTNLQYNVGSKYQIIVIVKISLSPYHHIYDKELAEGSI